MKANASEQLRRSPAKGAAAVASILQDIETMHPTCKAMIAEASEAAKQVPQGLPYRNHLLRQVGSETMFEFCCDEDSTLGQVNEEFGINHFRLTEKNSNVEDPKQVESLKKLVQLFPGCDLWGSIPCSPWSNWQTMNEHKLGEKFKAKLKRQRARSRRILRNFIAVAEVVLSQGGHVAFEWPKNAAGWALPELIAFIKRHNLYEARTDGCAHGLCDKNGVPHLKPWRIITSCWKLAQIWMQKGASMHQASNM